MDRLYQPKTEHIDDTSEFKSKLAFGFLCFDTFLKERKKPYLPFFKSDNLSLAIQDFLSSKKMLIFYNSPYLEANKNPLTSLSLENTEAVSRKKAKLVKTQPKVAVRLESRRKSSP